MKEPTLKARVIALEAQNKQLKALLKNAVQLLDRYKPVLEQAATRAPAKRRTVSPKKRAK
jgi:hypothetical protein